MNKLMFDSMCCVNNPHSPGAMDFKGTFLMFSGLLLSPHSQSTSIEWFQVTLT